MKWNPIETAPNDELILLSDGKEVFPGWWVAGRNYPWSVVDITVVDDDLRGQEDMVVELNGYRPGSFTHWMPLPEPPTKEETP